MHVSLRPLFDEYRNSSFMQSRPWHIPYLKCALGAQHDYAIHLWRNHHFDEYSVYSSSAYPNEENILARSYWTICDPFTLATS